MKIEKSDVNNSFNKFMNKANKVIDKHFPYKKLSNKEFKNTYKPWIINEIIDLINKQNII